MQTGQAHGITTTQRRGREQDACRAWARRGTRTEGRGSELRPGPGSPRRGDLAGRTRPRNKTTSNPRAGSSDKEGGTCQTACQAGQNRQIGLKRSTSKEAIQPVRKRERNSQCCEPYGCGYLAVACRLKHTCASTTAIYVYVISVCRCEYLYICLCLRMCVHMYTCIYVHVYTYPYTCTSVCTYIYMHNMHLHVCRHACIYSCIYTCCSSVYAV